MVNSYPPSAGQPVPQIIGHFLLVRKTAVSLYSCWTQQTLAQGHFSVSELQQYSFGDITFLLITDPLIKTIILSSWGWLLTGEHYLDVLLSRVPVIYLCACLYFPGDHIILFVLIRTKKSLCLMSIPLLARVNTKQWFRGFWVVMLGAWSQTAPTVWLLA